MIAHGEITLLLAHFACLSRQHLHLPCLFELSWASLTQLSPRPKAMGVWIKNLSP